MKTIDNRNHNGHHNSGLSNGSYNSQSATLENPNYQRETQHDKYREITANENENYSNWPDRNDNYRNRENQSQHTSRRNGIRERRHQNDDYQQGNDFNRNNGGRNDYNNYSESRRNTNAYDNDDYDTDNLRSYNDSYYSANDGQAPIGATRRARRIAGSR